MFTKIHCIPSYRLNLILVEIQIRPVRLVNHSNQFVYILHHIKLIVSHDQSYRPILWVWQLTVTLRKFSPIPTIQAGSVAQGIDFAKVRRERV